MTAPNAALDDGLAREEPEPVLEPELPIVDVRSDPQPLDCASCCTSLGTHCS